MALHTVSIAHILDVTYDENVSPDEALARNKRDAETRPVVWDAEALVQTVTDEDAKVVEAAPVGIKDLSGRFLPMETVMELSLINNSEPTRHQCRSREAFFSF